MRDFNKKLRVVLIDDNANHLRGIKELINLESSYDVVGTTKCESRNQLNKKISSRCCFDGY